MVKDTLVTKTGKATNHSQGTKWALVHYNPFLSYLDSDLELNLNRTHLEGGGGLTGPAACP